MEQLSSSQNMSAQLHLYHPVKKRRKLSTLQTEPFDVFLLKSDQSLVTWPQFIHPLALTLTLTITRQLYLPFVNALDTKTASSVILYLTVTLRRDLSITFNTR